MLSTGKYEVGSREYAHHATLPSLLLTRYVDRGARVEMGPSYVAIQGYGAVTFTPPPDLLRVCEILHAVRHYIGVCTTPVQGAELHDRDEPGQIVDLRLRILSMYQPGKVEQLCTLCMYAKRLK